MRSGLVTADAIPCCRLPPLETAAAPVAVTTTPPPPPPPTCELPSVVVVVVEADVVVVLERRLRDELICLQTRGEMGEGGGATQVVKNE